MNSNSIIFSLPDGYHRLLKVKELNTFYGRAHILSDVNFEVRKGEVAVLLGRNGAGKSTSLKSIMGLVKSASGEVFFNDRLINNIPTHMICRLGLGYVPEDRRIFTELTVMENLDVGCQPKRAGCPTWTLDRLFELFPNLGTMRTRLGGRISGGEQQMLTIARTLMGNPAMILLDEPSEGLAPIIVEEMARTIRGLKTEGLTVLLSEQKLHFASQVSDRAYIIEKGQIKYQGSMEDLAADKEIRQAYLMV